MFREVLQRCAVLGMRSNCDSHACSEAPQLEKIGHYVFHMERMLNEIKFFRQKKQQQMADLQNEFDVAEEQESREQVCSFTPLTSCLLLEC